MYIPVRLEAPESRRFGASARCAVAAVVFAFGFVAGGCVSEPEDLPGIVRGVELDDVPMPGEMMFVSSTKYEPVALSGDSFRSWSGTYQGEPELGELAAWFVKHMPEHGWTYRGARPEEGSRQLLRFRKRREVAHIEVYSKVNLKTGSRTSFVTASVHPLPSEDYPVEGLRDADFVVGNEKAGDAAATENKGDTPSGDADSQGEVRPAGFQADDAP